MNHTVSQLGGVSSRPRPAPGGNRRGVVLFVVVVVVVILSLAGLSFVSEMYIENKAVRLRGDELQIECLVNSGVEAVKVFCEQSPDRREAVGGAFDNPDLFRGVAVLQKEVDGRQDRFCVISPRIEQEQVAGIRFGIENESTRLNLTVLLQWEQRQEGAAREALMSLPGMSESIADAILDWIDADGTRRQFGAEADYYSGINVPYGPRNALPTSLEELLLVRDVTRELLFGPDANFNHRIDPEEARYASRSAGSDRAGGGLPWASLLTVFSAERNLDPDGKPRIDLNEKDLATLHQRLTEKFDQGQANFIIAYRQFGPYSEEEDSDTKSATEKSEPDRREKRLKSASAIDVDASKPAKFKIASVLHLVGAEIRIPGKTKQDEEIILEPSFPDDPQAMRDYLPTLLDHATVDTSPVIRGRINVNEAPRTVLRSVPGMDDTLVDRIVSARGPQGNPQDPGRRHATWLLTEGLVDFEQMRALLPYLTSGGDVFRAQVVGCFDGPGPAGRVEVVIDATSTPPRQVYWKDLRLLGIGYPPETLGAEMSAGTSRFGAGAGVDGP